MKRTAVWVVVAALLLCGSLTAKDKHLEWLEITDADWAVVQDSGKGITDAAFIFEKIRQDDKDLQKDRCYRTIYRRIRILSEEGRSWADVKAPHLQTDQKIEKVFGRTILRDGSIIELQEDQVFEKEAIKTRDAKVKETTFSLPGVTSDCIIEYIIHYKLPSSEEIWTPQKEIPVLDAQMTWRFGLYRVPDFFSDIMLDYVTPNYLFLNTLRPPTVRSLPGGDKTDSLLFEMGFLPKFDPEPYTLPDATLKTRLITYYGSQKSSAEYWGEMSTAIDDNFKKFCKKDKEVKKIVESFGTLETDDEKIAAAYNWIQENIHNLTYYTLYDPDKPGEKMEIKDLATVEDVVKRGYGYSGHIHRLFCNMLRLMDINAKMAYTRDRSEDMLVSEAKYWQFDQSMVAIDYGMDRYEFYAPGLACTPVDMLPWFIEGVSAFIAHADKLFVNPPMSTADRNTMSYVYSFEVDEDLEVTGSFKAELDGHNGRTLRIKLTDEDVAEHNKILKEAVEEYFGDRELSIESFENFEDISKPFTLTCSLDHPDLTETGSRIILTPCTFLRESSDPFVKNTRRYDILFNYPYHLEETADIALPPGYTIEALPENRRFDNGIGKCAVSWEMKDGKLVVNRMFEVTEPFIRSDGYHLVRDLFQAREDYSRQAVVLTQGGDSAQPSDGAVGSTGM